jgi:hypothetical protein
MSITKLQQQQPSLLFPSKLGYAKDKPHESKKGTKQERKIRGKQRAIKNQIKKGEKTIKR